ncbi:hypothetical protein GGQ66_003859 [Rhizobium borbori]|uniref:Uncharacterized protein n=1 Tax=Allorhizobium borbori TaxID=485907 RepID=A0A7W6K776_9HYPH|nr:hypothetical protein [Allorhizobium borbori]
MAIPICALGEQERMNTTCWRFASHYRPDFEDSVVPKIKASFVSLEAVSLLVIA